MRNKLFEIFLITLLVSVNVIAIKVYLKAKPEQITKVEEHKIVIEMDRSCYEQFENNMDKSVYLKLNFK